MNESIQNAEAGQRPASRDGDTAGQRPASRVSTLLDMARVQRWAELLDGDPQAREFMRERIAGSELPQLTELSRRSRRLELALQHGIPAPLAEVHLTADDPALLEQQAQSLARLLSERGSSDPHVGLTGAGGPEGPRSVANPLPAYESAPINREEWLEQQFKQVYEQ